MYEYFHLQRDTWFPLAFFFVLCCALGVFILFYIFDRDVFFVQETFFFPPDFTTRKKWQHQYKE